MNTPLQIAQKNFRYSVRSFSKQEHSFHGYKFDFSPNDIQPESLVVIQTKQVKSNYLLG